MTAVAKDEKWPNKFVEIKNGCLRQEDKWYDLTKGDTEFLRRKALRDWLSLVSVRNEGDTIVAATMCVAVVRSSTRRTAQCIAQTNIMYVSERGIKQGLEKDSIHKAMRAKMQCCFRWYSLVGKLYPGHHCGVFSSGGCGYLF